MADTKSDPKAVLAPRINRLITDMNKRAETPEVTQGTAP